MYQPIPLESLPWYIAVPACIILTISYFIIRHYQDKKEK